jgi:hypothetical protein
MLECNPYRYPVSANMNRRVSYTYVFTTFIYAAESPCWMPSLMISQRSQFWKSSLASTELTAEGQLAHVSLQMLMKVIFVQEPFGAEFASEFHAIAMCILFDFIQYHAVSLLWILILCLSKFHLFVYDLPHCTGGLSLVMFSWRSGC